MDHHAAVVAPVAALISHIAMAVLDETNTHVTMVMLEDMEDEDEVADTHVTIMTLKDPRANATTPVIIAMAAPIHM